MDEELKWVDPWPKFLCIKGVVFMTFWQNLAVQGFEALGVLDAHECATAEAFLISVEMFAFAIFHHFTFPPDEWSPTFRARHALKAAEGLAEAGGGGGAGSGTAGDLIKDVAAVLQGREYIERLATASPSRLNGRPPRNGSPEVAGSI